MNKNNLDGLFKNDDNDDVVPTAKKLAGDIGNIGKICLSLNISSKEYEPDGSIDAIDTYLNNNDKLDRILYSQISNYIFSLDESNRGIFITNTEKLLHFALNDNNNINEDKRKIIIKIYDHSQLVLYQIENANKIFGLGIENTKDNLKKEIKIMEREYITILGIFASIVLAFVGGLTFSTSVLSNISQVSIYRLLLVVDFIAFAIINVIYLLIHFITVINDKNDKAKIKFQFFKIKWVNWVLFIIAVVIIIGWLCSIRNLPDFILNFLPWKTITR